MARLVVDTNSLLQCISRRSRYHDLWISLFDGRNTLCVTTVTVDSLGTVLSERGLIENRPV